MERLPEDTESGVKDKCFKETERTPRYCNIGCNLLEYIHTHKETMHYKTGLVNLRSAEMEAEANKASPIQATTHY